MGWMKRRFGGAFGATVIGVTAVVVPALVHATPAGAEDEYPVGAALTILTTSAKWGTCVTGAGQDQATRDQRAQQSDSEFLTGCALEALGLGGPKADPAVLRALAQINQKLDLIQAQLDSVTTALSQVNNAVFQAGWNAFVQNLRTNYLTNVDNAFTQLRTATSPLVDRATQDHAAVLARKDIAEIYRKDDTGIGFAKELLGEAGTTGGVRSLVEKVAQQSGRYVRNANGVTQGGISDSVIQDIWAYLVDYQVKLTYLLVEGANANVAGAPARPTHAGIVATIEAPLLGSPTSVPDVNPSRPPPLPAGAAFPNCGPAPISASSRCLGWLQQEEGLLPLPVPRGASVDTNAGLMWFQGVGQPTRYNLLGTDVQLPGGVACDYDDCPQPSAIDHLNKFNANYNLGFTDWSVPTKGQLTALLASQPPGTGSRLGWLSGSVGFFTAPEGTTGPPKDVKADPLASMGSPAAWTRTGNTVHCGYESCPGGSYTVLTTVNLATGALGEHATKVSVRDNRFSVMAVRPLSACSLYAGTSQYATQAGTGRDRACRLTVLSAQYGAGKRWKDVTGLVQGYAVEGHLALQVENLMLGGDPAPGANKTLKLTYWKGGASQPTTMDVRYLGRVNIS